ncbi:MAG TPA: cytochrome c [Terriglobales bacterium]
MRQFIIGLVLGLLIVPLGLYLYFTMGMAPVATSASPMPFEKMLAHKALEEWIEKEMPKTVPIPADEPNYLAGAQVYKDKCAVCHGLPLESESAIAKGMYPKPPQLLRGKGVTDDEPGETYWKVANGIRLTGMPGFSQSLSERQMWQVSLLLAHADKLPESAKASLIESVNPEPPSSSTAPAPTK